MRGAVLVLALIAALPVSAQDAEELRIAREVLTRLQPISFDKKREYCGYIGYDENGVLKASAAVAGTRDTCSARFPRNLAITASYHTHGDFDDGYFNEIPSDIDMEGDREFYMNGYVSTPGGRLWYIDTQIMLATQICGVSCLPVAGGFRKGPSGDIAESYSYDALRDKLAE